MMDWFPQQYAAEFNWVKALIAASAAVLLIVHMQRIWPETPIAGQKLRYVILLGYALLTSFNSASLARTDEPVKLVNVLSFFLTIGLIFVIVQSMREWHRGIRYEV